MLRTSLTEAQRNELRALRRTDLPAVACDRLEMVFLSDAGWSPPRIAGHLGRHPHTVRAALQGFAARGTAAFYPDAPGPDPDHARRAARARERARARPGGRPGPGASRGSSPGTGHGPRGSCPTPSAPTSASAPPRPAATSG